MGKILQDQAPACEILAPLLRFWFGWPGQEWPGKGYVTGSCLRLALCGRHPKSLRLAWPDAAKCAQQLAARHNAVLTSMKTQSGLVNWRLESPQDGGKRLDIVGLDEADIEFYSKNRDFSLDCLALPLEADGGFGDLVDACHGLTDLRSRILRPLSEDVFRDDPLRLLRAARLCAELDLTLPPGVEEMMIKAAPCVAAAHVLRVRDSLLRLLEMPCSLPGVLLLDRITVLESLFPEIRAMRSCKQNGRHHLDVWGHSLEVFRHCETIIVDPSAWFGSQAEVLLKNLASGSRLPLLKLAAMLHDIGKPATRAIKPETGRITFYGHDVEGSHIVDRIAQRFALSDDQRHFLVTLVGHHLRVLNLCEPGASKGARRRWFRDIRDDAPPELVLGMADVMGTLGPESRENERMNSLKSAVNLMREYYESAKPTLERPRYLTGSDVQKLGLLPGPAIGYILKKIDSAVDAGEVTDKESALRLARDIMSTDMHLIHAESPAAKHSDGG